MKKTIFLFVLGILIITGSCHSEKKYSPDEIRKESARTNQFFEKCFQADLERSPTFQTYLGIKDDYDKWDDLSEAFMDAGYEKSKNELHYLLDSINPEALDKHTRISYKLFKLNKEHELEGQQFRHHNYPVNQMFGLQSEVPSFLINMHNIQTKKDALDYIARIINVQPLFDQLIESLILREEKGIVPPTFVFAWCIEASKNVITGEPFNKGEKSTILADFSEKASKLEIAGTVKDSLITSCKQALTNNLKPAYQKLISFLESQEKRSNNDVGVWKFPDGEAFFNYELKTTTTTDLTSDEIFELGKQEVARIQKEMHDIMNEVNFEGSLQEFFTFVKNDDQFYYPNTDEGKQAYIDSAEVLINTIQNRLDEIFITKPKALLEVKRVEAFREKSAGKAFYESPSPDGSRPGRYYANLYDSRNMPKYEMEALAYHEGLPGHHMDRSISQELSDLPKFRKHGGYTAYIEGWGLYSEYLPKEMGMYQDPYSDFGRLAMELWRACRLVVDCGIHSKKWTREEGIAYYEENTPGSKRDCERMVERHIVMPSQATAYKIGMIKILELRENAKAVLGEKFDLREFHEVVLTNGAVPLNVLDELVADWVQSK